MTQQGQPVDMCERQYAQDPIVVPQLLVRHIDRLHLTRDVVVTRLDTFGPARRSARITQIRRLFLGGASGLFWDLLFGP